MHARDRVFALVFALGVASPQLVIDERGFSYQVDAPLDMRMNQNESLTAKTIVNEYSVTDLTFILKTYDEERFAHRIARTIATERKKHPLDTTYDLIKNIKRAIPAP